MTAVLVNVQFAGSPLSDDMDTYMLSEYAAFINPLILI